MEVIALKLYVNMMETICEEMLKELEPELDCCLCEQCRNDIIACALNNLPCRYVVTQAGGSISKADAMRIQHLTDVRTAVLQAAQVVKEHPRH